MEWDGQRSRAPSTPTSELSHSTSGTGSSREKIPPYKQLNPSPVIAALSKLSDDDLFRKGGDELLHMLRRVESDYKNLLSDHSAVVKDVNRRFQIFVLEARGLKEINQKLQDDNQELRDLCCFLDDDRQRSRKLAREWQRFGRYTASVMHSEVVAYQEKLKQLEERQAELLSDNLELKELCLFLDHERSQMSGDRDDGDGSSNGTMPGQEDVVQSQGDSDSQLTPTPTPTPSQQPTESPYVRQLELKIQRLEEEKKQLAQRVERNGADGYRPTDQEGLSRNMRQDNKPVESRQGATTPGRDRPAPSVTANKPEAVVHAMKVLQVHDQLERHPDSRGGDNLETPQKAIVREMCNVVWRKLGDVGEYPPHTVPSSSHPSPHPQSHHPHPSHLHHHHPNTSVPIPYRPQSAAGNPIHASSGHPGPPPLSKSLPSSLSLPGSPTAGPPSFPDPHPHMQRTPPASSASPGEGSGPGGTGPGGERRSQIPQSSRHTPGQAKSPGRREDYAQGSMGMYGQGRENVSGQGRDNIPGQGRENIPGQGIREASSHGSRGVMQASENKGSQGTGYPQPGSHPADRPRHLQPPPYSSAKTSPSTMSHGPGHSPQYPPPSQSHPPPSQSHPPPSQSHPPPPSKQQQQSRFQQRVHPLHANQGPVSSQGHHLPRSASGPATYYVSHPTSQSKSHTASAMPAYHQPTPSASLPAPSFMYAQRGGGGGRLPAQYQSLPDQAPRSGGESGRTERRQTYLDD